MSNIWMVLQQTAAASLVACFLLFLQRLFRDKLSPKWQYNIWLVLLCRLVVPAGWGSGSQLDATLVVDILRIAAEQKLASAWSSPWTVDVAAVGLPVFPMGGAPQSITDWLFVIYLVGVALCALWLLMGWLRLRKLVRGALPVLGERQEKVKALADQFGLKGPVQVVESRAAHGPFLVGVLRPTLVVPMGWQVDGKVVLHELLHLKNKDVFAGWVSALVRCIHWCNPFLWWVFDRIDNQREERCDQQVLERLVGEERRDYGRVLLSMAEDEAVRVPGATSMANGANRIKVRIQSIARFQTFPKGMGLVSVCMTLILIPHLVVGFAAAEGEEPFRLRSPQQVLAYAQRSPCTTVAGALDAYATWMYYRLHSPYTALLAHAMVSAEEDMPQTLAEYEESREGWGENTYLRIQEMDASYRTGPIFRALTQLEENRWVCQVYMFRDQKLEIGPIPDEIPVEYLCHTVEITRQENGAHTIKLLKETKGEMSGETDLWRDMWEEPPVIWTGTAGGVEVKLYPYQTMLVRGGWINGMTRSMWNFLNTEWSRERYPDPNANFGACYGGMTVTLTNQNPERVHAELEADPEWGREEVGNAAVDDIQLGKDLEPGQSILWDTGTGGVEHYDSVTLERCLCPANFTATLTVDGVEYPLVLEREVSWE